MVEPLRHRQTKGAATDMFYLTPPRHISTLPKAPFGSRPDTSGLPHYPDIFSASWHVSNVPVTEMTDRRAVGACMLESTIFRPRRRLYRIARGALATDLHALSLAFIPGPF